MPTGLFQYSDIEELPYMPKIDYIGSYAFAYCNNLKSIDIPLNVDVVRSHAFYSCKNLNDEEFLVRGTWELNVAKQLNAQNILWTRDKKIEFLDLNGNQHTYTPDFYLPKTDEYIEVKGLFPEADKQKMDLVKEQHPEKRIFFICKKNYKQFIKGTISLSDEILY
jgi:hypothetical protein